MTNSKNDPSFYVDWACRITEDACLRSNRRLSGDGLEAFKKMYERPAKELAAKPAIFRAGSAEMQFWLAEAAELMVKSAEYSGSSTIEPAHIDAAAGALLQMRTNTGQFTTRWSCGVLSPPRPPIT